MNLRIVIHSFRFSFNSRTLNFDRIAKESSKGTRCEKKISILSWINFHQHDVNFAFLRKRTLRDCYISKCDQVNCCTISLRCCMKRSQVKLLSVKIVCFLKISSRKILSHLSHKKKEQIHDRELINYSEERNDHAKVSSIPYFRVKLSRTIFIVTQPRQKPAKRFIFHLILCVYFKC